MSNQRMEPIVIGMDLDGTIADYNQGLRETLHQKGIPRALEIPDPTMYNFIDDPAWPINNVHEYDYIHKQFIKFHKFATLNVIPGAKETLQKLHDEYGFHIQINTRRFTFNDTDKRTIVTDTVTWLDDNDIPYDSIHFSQGNKAKTADVYIDDAPSVIFAIRQADRPVIIHDTTYNKHVEGHRITWGLPIEKIVDILKWEANNTDNTQP